MASCGVRRGAASRPSRFSQIFWLCMWGWSRGPDQPNGIVSASQCSRRHGQRTGAMASRSGSLRGAPLLRFKASFFDAQLKSVPSRPVGKLGARLFLLSRLKRDRGCRWRGVAWRCISMQICNNSFHAPPVFTLISRMYVHIVHCTVCTVCTVYSISEIGAFRERGPVVPSRQ